MKYRKKPVVIEAVKWDGDADTANRFIGDRFGVDWKYTNAGDGSIVIPTLEGKMRAEVGDFIIKGVAGEFYPCKPDIFAKTYEPGVTGQAVAYTRVSTEEQAAFGGSLAMQAERLALYCQLQGLELVETIKEKGVSGSVPLGDRKGGKKLLALLEDGSIRHVVTLKLDRLFRDAADALTQTRRWDRADIDMHLVDLGGMSLNTRSAGGRMMLTMLAGFAEWERNLIAERTRAVLWHKRAKGEAYSPTPLGYAREGKRLVAVDSEQAILTTIREMHGRGLSLNAIAKELNERGVPTKRGKAWYASTVRYLLQNIQLHGKAA